MFGAERRLAQALAAWNAGDHGIALDLWAPLARRGHARAQSNMGAAFLEGRGVERDPAKAVHWLRRAAMHPGQDIWNGGWRYAEALLARQIWSNFPDTEVVYILEVEAEAVADVPASVVRQLAIGDEVDLAGRRLRILDVQDGVG